MTPTTRAKASEDACKIIVEDTLPEGNAGRERAITACEQIAP